MTEQILKRAFEFAENGDKGTVIDRENRIITLVCCKGATKEMLMEEWGLGYWFIQNGFNVEFEQRDIEYTTKGTFDCHSCTSYRGHKAYLRNRVVMTITW
jgi:hypothetical protein